MSCVVVDVCKLGVVVQNSGPSPQWPNIEQHGAFGGQSSLDSQLLLAVVVAFVVVVEATVEGFQQNSGPVPQCPNAEQHSPSWQSLSEEQITGFSEVVGAAGVVVATPQYSGPSPQ